MISTPYPSFAEMQNDIICTGVAAPDRRCSPKHGSGSIQSATGHGFVFLHKGGRSQPFSATTLAPSEMPTLSLSSVKALKTLADITQITPKLREIVPPFHRQGNGIPSAAIRWPGFGDRLSSGRPFDLIFRQLGIPFTPVGGVIA